MLHIRSLLTNIGPFRQAVRTTPLLELCRHLTRLRPITRPTIIERMLTVENILVVLLEANVVLRNVLVSMAVLVLIITLFVLPVTPEVTTL